MSGWAGAPRTPVAASRRPFNKISVRSGPRPRSEMLDEPTPPVGGASVALELPAFVLSVWSICVPLATVERDRSSVIEVTPIWRLSSTSSVVSGDGLVNASLRRREPVTTTVSRSPSSVAAAAAAELSGTVSTSPPCWAKAGNAYAKATPDRKVERSKLEPLILSIFSVLRFCF